MTRGLEDGGGGVEPLLEKYISYSPYQYGLLNPMNMVDLNGLEIFLPQERYDKLVRIIEYMRNPTNEFKSNYSNELNMFYSTAKSYIITDGDVGESNTLYSDDIMASTTIAYGVTYNKSSFSDQSIVVRLGSDFFDLDEQIAAIFLEHELHHAEYFSSIKNKCKTVSEFNNYFTKNENLIELYNDEISAYSESISRIGKLSEKTKDKNKQKEYDEIKKQLEDARKGYKEKKHKLEFLKKL